MSSDDGLQEPAFSDIELPSAPSSGKRKRDDEPTAPLSKRAAKRARIRAKKGPHMEDEALDAEAGVNRAIAHMDPQLMADHIAQRTKKYNNDLSTMELEEMRIPGGAIIDTTSWRKPRDLESLSLFLDHFSGPKATRPKMSDSSKTPGSPHTIIIGGAGMRAADLSRAVRRYQSKNAKVEKLFAKHIKMAEAVESLKKNRVCIGVGTPQRVIDLLEDGALKSADLRRIVVDASHIDSKKRGVLDMRETVVPLIKLLSRKEFVEGYEKEDGLRLLFF